MSKKNIANYVQHQLATNSAWALRALTRIYTLQTADEQAAGRTSHNNNIGFSGCDAEILSSLARQVNAGRNLSPKQMAIVHKRMPRYHRQIVTFIPADRLATIATQADAYATTVPTSVVS